MDNLFTNITRLGVYGQIVAKDAVESLTPVMKSFREDIARLGDGQKAKYRAEKN